MENIIQKGNIIKADLRKAFTEQIEFISSIRLLRFLYQPYKWLVVLPCLILLTSIMGSLAVISSLIFHPKISNFCGVIWAFFNAKLTPISVQVEGKENIDKNQSYIIVSNHLSHYDIFLLYGWLGIDFRWVMKQELRHVPFLGIACEKLGHIFVNRSEPKQAIASIQKAGEKLNNGTSVVFFPEGTRSRNGKIGKFKKGAFRMALDLNLPILPVSISGTNHILPPGTIDLLPGNARMVIHPPIDTMDYNGENLSELMHTTKKVILKKIEG